jgi:hypothetical protein
MPVVVLTNGDKIDASTELYMPDLDSPFIRVLDRAGCSHTINTAHVVDVRDQTEDDKPADRSGYFL